MITTLLQKPSSSRSVTGSSTSDPAGWLSNLIGRKTTSGEVVTEETALSVSTYYACIRNVAEDIGKLPFGVFERLQPRGRNPRSDHPVHSLLRYPNPMMSGQVFWETLTQWGVGWGNGYAEIERNRKGMPIALWPIHPSRVPPRKKATESYEVHGDNGTPVPVPVADMIHVRGMGNEVVGYSVVQLASETLGVALAAQTFGAAYFGNDAALGIVIKVPAGVSLKEEQIRDLRCSWIKPHVGANNAFKPKVLSDGITAERLSIPPKDSQFIETRGFQVEQICQWFRMPPHKVQYLARATNNNIEHQGIEYSTDTLMSWQVRIENECDLKLFSDSERSGLYVKINATALLRGDSAARGEFYNKMFMVGAMNPNDIREKEDENPRDGGDEYFVPGNMIGNQGTTPATNAQPGGAPQQQPECPDIGSIKAAMMPVFVDSVARLVRREANAMERARKKHAADKDAYSEWANEFYAGHEAVCIESLLPAMQSLAKLAKWDYANTEDALRGRVSRWMQSRMSAITGDLPDADATAVAMAVEFTEIIK